MFRTLEALYKFGSYFSVPGWQHIAGNHFGALHSAVTVCELQVCMRLCHAPNNSHEFLSLWPSIVDHFLPLRRQHWVASEQQSSPAFLQLNPQQLRRRSLYSSTLPARPAVLPPGIRKAPVAPAEQQAWVQRELQALTLQDDVKIVSQVVLRSVEALAKAFSNQGTRYCQSGFAAT